MRDDNNVELPPCVELTDVNLSEVAGGTTVRDAHDRYSNIDDASRQSLTKG